MNASIPDSHSAIWNSQSQQTCVRSFGTTFLIGSYLLAIAHVYTVVKLRRKFEPFDLLLYLLLEQNYYFPVNFHEINAIVEQILNNMLVAFIAIKGMWSIRKTFCSPLVFKGVIVFLIYANEATQTLK